MLSGVKENMNIMSRNERFKKEPSGTSRTEKCSISIENVAEWSRRQIRQSRRRSELKYMNRDHPQWSAEREIVEKMNKAPGICQTTSSRLNTSATVVPEAVEKELSQKKNIWRNNGSRFDEDYKPTGPRTSMNNKQNRQHRDGPILLPISVWAVYFQSRCHDNSLGKGNPTDAVATTDSHFGGKKANLDLFIPDTKNNSTWIIDLNIRAKSVKLLEEKNIDENIFMTLE